MPFKLFRALLGGSPSNSTSATRKAQRSRIRKHLLEQLEDRRVFAGFTPGNIAVYRVGDTAALTNAAAAAFIDEYTTSGTLVQSIALPTSDSGANQTLTNSGSATSEGALTRSADGQYLVFAGYDAAVGTAAVNGTSSATVARVIGRVGADGVVDTSTTTTAFSASNIRGAASLDGSGFWSSGGNTGVVYTPFGGSGAGTIVASNVTNTRVPQVVGGQLYVSSASGTLRLGTVGTGTPTTSGSTITNLPGFPTATISPYSYFFADLDTNVAGVDTLYVTDDSTALNQTTGAGGIAKYSLVSGNWTLKNVVGGASLGMRGLTGSVTNGVVTLFATQDIANDAIVTLVDSTGYNQNMTASFTTIATAGTNRAFRGVALVPVAADTTPPLVSTFSPVDNATNVPVGTNLAVTFNENIAKGTGNILIKKSSDNSTAFTIDITSAQASISGAVLTIDPSTSLSFDGSTEYYVQIPATAVKDLAGNFYAGLADTTSWSFTTAAVADTTPPTVTTLSPADDATNVALNTDLVITFSENVVKGSGNILVKRSSDNSVVHTIDVASALVTVSNNVVTINPSTDLANGTGYYVEIPATAFSDASNNFYLGISSATAWNFTTIADTTPPTVVSIDDGDADNAVVTNTLMTYTITFSEDIDAATVTGDDFNNQGTAAITIGTITETTPGVFTVQVTPTTAGTLILRIPTGAVITDTSGNALAVPVADNDTITVTIPDVTPPTLVSMVDDRGGAAINANLPIVYTLTFSEDIDATTVTAIDFDNAGTSTISIGAITETTPGVFTVVVTPTSAGTLTLRIPSTGVIRDTSGNALGVPVSDDTTITVNSVTSLAAGDIAFTAFQSDNTGGEFAGDAFAFVLLKSVVAGTAVFFTDNGYRTDTSAYRTNETMMRWVAQTDLAAGTKVVFIAPNGTAIPSTATWTGINPLTGASLTNATLTFATGGDNITALLNPTFGGTDLLNGTAIAQITFGGASFSATFDGASGNATTALAPGMIDGLTAVSIAATDNGKYNETAIGSVESGPASVLAGSLNTDRFWSTSGTPFTVGNTPATFSLTGAVATSLFINEVLFDPIAAVDTGEEFIELRGTPNGYVPANAYLILLDGDSEDTAGNIDQVFYIAGMQFSANGYIVLRQAGSTYSVAGGATDFVANGTGWGTDFSSRNTDIENGAVSVLIIQTNTAPVPDTDVDSDNNGTLDSAAASWTVADALGNIDGGANDTAYGFFNTSGNGQGSVPSGSTFINLNGYHPDYMARIGDSTGATGSDWVVGELAGSMPNISLATGGFTRPSSFEGVSLNSLGGTNPSTLATPVLTVTAPNAVYTGVAYAGASVSITGAASPTPTASFTYYVGTGTGGTNLGSSAPTNVGTYTVVATTPTNSANNAATSAPVTFQITPKSLTPTATAANKTYDGNTAAVVTVSLSGVISGQTVTGSASGTFDTKNVGNAKTVTVGTITLGGADAGNYTVGAASTTTANITAKSLTPTATAANKTYDGNTAAVVTVSLAGVVSGETVNGSASGTFDTKNVGNAKTVTVSTITLGGADAGNYTVGAASTTTANITAKSLTPTATAANKTYDGNTSAVVTVSLAGVVSGETVTGSASGTFDTKNVGNAKTVTVGTITLGGADAGNYTVGAASTTTANITAKSLTPTATAANKTYDGNTAAVVTVSLSGVISGETVTGSASGTFDSKNVGTGKAVTVGAVTLAGADAGNYTVGAAANTTADITAKLLTPTATAANKTYDGNTSAVVTVSLGGVISGETVTGSASGTFDTKNVGNAKTVTVGTVTLGGADAGNYTVGAAASTTANITAKSLTPNATAANKTYDGNTSAVVTISLGGVLSGETVTGSASGTFDNKNIGTGKAVTVGTVTLGGADAGNYTVGAAANTTADVTAKLLTPTATAANKAYDGNTTAVVTVSLAGVISGETVTGSASGTFDTKNVGIGKTVTVGAVTLGGADAGNYTVGAASTTTANITAKSLTPTATASNKTYDGNTTAVVTISLAGVVSGETVTGSASGTFDTKNVGNAKTVTVGTVTLAGADAGNYTVGVASNTTANITAKSLTPTATAANKTYDGNTTAVVTVSLGGVLSGETVTGSATGTFDNKNIGTGKTVTVGTVTLAGADAGNYTVGAAANTTADVTAKLLTATATAANKTYDGNTTAVVTVSLSGVVSGETVTGSASGTFDTKNVGTGKAVTVGAVTLGGADAGNYTVGTAANTTASITAKSLTPTATAANKTYDGNTSAVVTISLGGVISGETVTGSASGTFDNKNVGIAKTVTVGTVTLGGADAGNYTVAVAANTTANVTAKSLTPTATAANKTYDGNTSAVVTISLGGVISGETVTGSASGTFDTKNVGNAKTVTVGAVTLGGADAGNYTVGAAANTTANITAKTLIGSVTVLDKVFDGNTNATIDTRTLSGVISGESVTYVGGTTAFPSSAVGTYVLTVTGLSLSGSDAGNYTVNTTANATASITNGPTAPLVSSVVINGGDTFLNPNQKSIITSFTVNFSTTVTLASGAFILRNIDTNVQVANLVITPNGSSTQFTVRFGDGAGVHSRLGTGSRGNSLVDGNYRLQIDATKVTAGSTAMAADYFFGNNFSDNFFRLFGDADGDGDVDGTDTVAFRRSYLGVENNAAMDFDGDGVTLNDAQDLAGYNANRNKVRRGR